MHTWSNVREIRSKTTLKKLFQKKEIRIIAAVLVVVLLVALIMSARPQKASPAKNLTGTLSKPIQTVVSAAASWLENIYGYMYEFDTIKAENEQLKSEIAKLQEDARDAENALEENARLTALLGFKEKHSDFELESVKIIGRSVTNWSSTYTINKGTNDGIEVGDCVITENGELTGQVTEVGSGWATVTTIIDSSASIGAIANEASATGLVMGDYSLMALGYAKLTYLPNDSQIFKGDTILTAGTEDIFPDGLVIGTIEAVQLEAGGQVEYGVVKPACDLNSLTQVFVIKSFDVVK